MPHGLLGRGLVEAVIVGVGEVGGVPAVGAGEGLPVGAGDGLPVGAGSGPLVVGDVGIVRPAVRLLHATLFPSLNPEVIMPSPLSQFNNWLL